MAELIEKLGIDWKLLAAQTVNFLVLLFLLKKFLYSPIIELLAKRREDIAQAAKNAERIGQELARIQEQKAQELDAAKKEAEALLADTRRIAKEKEQEFLQLAEKKVEKLVEEAKRRIEEERAKMIEEAGGEIRDLVVLVAEKVLGERFSDHAHDALVEESIGAIRSMKNPRK